MSARIIAGQGVRAKKWPHEANGIVLAAGAGPGRRRGAEAYHRQAAAVGALRPDPSIRGDANRRRRLLVAQGHGHEHL